ncbi:hypothetical protein LJC58_10215 [Lachnospiraceae bacterium OttesenSCG-928-D06]|nr:hypothetical protein [Lachnospiraceae bacterium OttesenSCG-928-D06]
MKVIYQEFLKIHRFGIFRLFVLIFFLSIGFSVLVMNRWNAVVDRNPETFNYNKGEKEGIRISEHVKDSVRIEDIWEEENSLEQKLLIAALRMQNFNNFRDLYAQGEEKELLRQVGDIDAFYFSYGFGILFEYLLNTPFIVIVFCPICMIFTVPLFSNEKSTSMTEIIKATKKGKKDTVKGKYIAAMVSVFAAITLCYFFVCIFIITMSGDWASVDNPAKYYLFDSNWERIMLCDLSVMELLLVGYLHYIVCGFGVCGVICGISSFSFHNTSSLIASLGFVYIPIVICYLTGSPIKYLFPSASMNVAGIYSGLGFINVFGIPVQVRYVVLPVALLWGVIGALLCYKRETSIGRLY